MHVPPEILATELAIFFSDWWRWTDRPALLKGVWARIVLVDENADAAGEDDKDYSAGQETAPPAPPAIDIAAAVGANLTCMQGAASSAANGRPQG